MGDVELSSAQAELKILRLVAELDRSRILSIAERVEKRGVRKTLEDANSRLLSGRGEQTIEPGFRRWLERCPFTAAPPKSWSPETVADLIGWASDARWLYSEQFQAFLGFNLAQKPLWLDCLHKISRYRSATKSMVKLAVKQHELFADIRIQAVEAPSTRSFSLWNERAPLLAAVKNLVREDSEATMERLKQHFDTSDVEARLRATCRLSLTLHAEMQIAVFYEGNSSLVPRMPFIGTSKKACFLCHQYLLHHPLRLKVSACHQKIYPSWMPPPYYPVPGRFRSPTFYKLSKNMEQLLRQELKTALTAPRRPRTQDSTAGPSLTTTATAPAGLGSRQAATEGKFILKEGSASELLE